MYANRKQLYLQLEEQRKSKVLCYVTGDRPGLETQIHPEVYDFFVNHFDVIGSVPKISLYLYTRGGQTLAAWSLVNLMRRFGEKVEVIVPSKAHSAGTLICLGADSILMTKQATLGPIDPSVNTPLNPSVPGAAPGATVPVSVEAIKGFIELVKEEVKIDDSDGLARVVVALVEKVHPLVLGQVYRSRSQIQMLARRLVSRQVKSKEKVDKIVGFLCSESGSHDYTIDRSEAKSGLGLRVEKPDDKLYALVKAIYDDIRAEMELGAKFDPNSYLGAREQGNYAFKRAILESVAGGSDFFVSEGTLTKRQITVPPGVQQIMLQDQREFEGWKHENA